MPRIDNNSLQDLFDNKYAFSKESKVAVNALTLIEELTQKQLTETRLEKALKTILAQAERINYLEERLAYIQLTSNDVPYFNIKA